MLGMLCDAGMHMNDFNFIWS